VTGHEVALVAFSFGLRGVDQEPNPCNVRLAKEVERILRDHRPAPVCAQWEISKQLEFDDHPPDLTVPPTQNQCLSSDDVWAQAAAFLQQRGVDRVIPVAHPYLHLHRVKSLIKRSGFRVVDVRIRHIGFDRSRTNTQWWTKGPLRLTLYALIQAIRGRRR
jgi:hypothetical protein